ATATPVWLSSYDQALKFARKSKHPVLLNFTGSDWCLWCRRMNKEALGTKEFIRFASTNLLLVEVDFPEKTPQPDAVKQSNAALQAQFGVTGFPTFILVSPDGKELGRHVGYLEGGAPAFTSRVRKWMEGSGSGSEAGPVDRRPSSGN
ncbi:MAG: thioredoxin family protein, partial [Verrucomicrobiales bacterium]|nr:thioredoxin family protein [Verrucomicrobiales bacterium]